jgi:hypothetical protein
MDIPRAKSYGRLGTPDGQFRGEPMPLDRYLESRCPVASFSISRQRWWENRVPGRKLIEEVRY